MSEEQHAKLNLTQTTDLGALHTTIKEAYKSYLDRHKLKDKPLSRAGFYTALSVLAERAEFRDPVVKSTLLRHLHTEAARCVNDQLGEVEALLLTHKTVWRNMTLHRQDA